MKCPACEVGNLIQPAREIPDWLEPPVMECDECGDLFSLPGIAREKRQTQ